MPHQWVRIRQGLKKIPFFEIQTPVSLDYQKLRCFLYGSYLQTEKNLNFIRLVAIAVIERNHLKFCIEQGKFCRHSQSHGEKT
jgi:hypothetical protein